ncbi:PQQ-binding-like beta-propeller repeat protein [Promicromonospora panici]|uniref:outer membrane protein assembly factor BamB family protein n=1 Tax=Promicromonospora panici TaxID=2219658 RepID=UPI00101D5E96|nr:PQQ-binding-like beta-propeller repeat protein [Promicromonospora panici]
MPRPDKKESVVFDLVEDNGPADAADGGPDAAGTEPSLLSRLPRPSRRTWVIAAAVVAAVAVTLVSVDLVRDHRRAELMRTSSVGVASLADPPEPTWTVPFDVPTGRASDAHLGQQLVVMDGLLVLPPTSTPGYPADSATGVFEAPPRFTGVVAVDPGSGEVAWRIPVDENPECGPSGYDASISTEVLVCVHGPDVDRQVLTITPDGTTRSRPLDLVEGERVFPGPDGMVVRTVRTGDPIGYLACDEAGNCPPRILDEGRSLRVAAEDAGTGAERWTSVIEFDPTISDSCQTWPADIDSTPDEPTYDPDLTTVSVGAESVVVAGCGLAATLSVDGTRLDLAGDLLDPAQVWVTELGSGRFAVEGDAAQTVVVNADGKILRTVQGRMSSGPAAPDAPDDLWFVTRTSGVGFAAVREDGSEAWTALQESRVALAARDVVVVNRENRLLGLDRATGAKMWGWADDDPRGLANFRTLTDGEAIAVQLLPQDGVGEGVLVAIDLGTGEELWEVPLTGAVVAVDGQLVEFTSDGVRGLG